MTDQLAILSDRSLNPLRFLIRVLVVVWLVLTVWTLLDIASVAFAEDLTEPEGMVMGDDTIASLRISATLVSMLIATFIPLLTALLTKVANQWKGFITALLTLATTVTTVGLMGDGTAIISQQTILTFAISLIQAVIAYLAWWKNRKVTVKLQNSGNT